MKKVVVNNKTCKVFHLAKQFHHVFLLSVFIQGRLLVLTTDKKMARYCGLPEVTQL